MEQISSSNRLTGVNLNQQDSLVALVQGLKQGEPHAAEILVDRFYRQIYLYLRELGLNKHLSEDLTQETFLRAWNSISQLHDEYAVSAWLYRIASNTAREHWRREKTRHRLDQQELGLSQAMLRDGQGNQSDLKDQFEMLWEAINALNWKQRQAVVLHYLQEFTIAEAAEIADVREGTLKSRLSRALNSLRRRLPSE